ncbi:hypothetical protein [Pantoea sp. GbtcB22]|uniref:FitA-like ribbon-helix-helix domain-containing protein n=1 Tax=Pantoea sp. GbtcB22 TaxID=2824767 RepID=UPI001C30ABEF|nr:hypothetical protein [Pantoea sp. GbtcB22]
MAKIQARNVDDVLYQRIEASAMRNERSIEGEVRTALRDYYQPAVEVVPALTKRESWQQQTGQRLQWLFDRLKADGLLDKWKSDKPADTTDIVRVARMIDNSPGKLMDYLDGLDDVSAELTDKLSTHFGVSSDWLLTGEGSPFAVIRLGSRGFTEFFLPPEGGNFTFELIRIRKGRHEGTLIILRTCTDTGHTEVGVVTEAFYLGSGMGSGGYGNLKHFLKFLKSRGAHLTLNTYEFTPPDPDFDFWSVIGHHHAVWYQDARLRSTTRWLQQVFNGEDPGGWFSSGWAPLLKEIGDMPFGQDENKSQPAHDVREGD